MSYSFIGLGNMASAIIRGIVASDSTNATKIIGFNRTITKSKQLAAETAIRVASTLEETLEADLLFIGVKPHQIEELAPTLKGQLKPHQLIISMAAGTSIETLQRLFDHPHIMRIMPNVNAAVHHSTTAYAVAEEVSATQKDAAVQLLQATGSMIELEEDQFGIFSSIAGASPAFHYLYIDAIARAAVKEGMPKNIALQIAADAVLGSAKMVLESQTHPIELVDQVCSPGGTTIEGVMALKANQFEHAVHEAVHAVIEKDQSFQD